MAWRQLVEMVTGWKRPASSGWLCLADDPARRASCHADSSEPYEGMALFPTNVRRFAASDRMLIDLFDQRKAGITVY
jgi:hypothetical protein